MKNIVKVLLLLSCCMLFTLQAFAQIEVRLEPDRKQYLIGESVIMKFSIANHTDRTITFKNIPSRPWLTFRVTSSASPYPLSPVALPKFPNVTLKPGQQQSYKLDLKPFFNFNMDGVYKAVAIVLMPDLKNAYTSNAATYNMSSGGILKTFNIQKSGRNLNVYVKQMQVNGKNCLFGQVREVGARSAIGACYMGKFLNFMDPRIRMDSSQNLHVLCQSTPELFTYSIMNSNGKRVSINLFKRSGGPVDLVYLAGKVQPVGLIPYVAPKPEEEDVHKASESPF